MVEWFIDIKTASATVDLQPTEILTFGFLFDIMLLPVFCCGLISCELATLKLIHRRFYFMFENREKWNVDRFWLEWYNLPNRRKFTINNHNFTSISGSTKLELSCLKCKRSFEITVANFFEWKKCILCYPLPAKNNSIGEIYITKYLLNKKIKFETQKRFKSCKNINPLPFDFYLPDYDILLELQGAHHYFPVSYGSDQRQETKEKNLKAIQDRDAIKRQWAKDNGFTLIELTYTDLDNLDHIIYSYQSEFINSDLE